MKIRIKNEKMVCFSITNLTEAEAKDPEIMEKIESALLKVGAFDVRDDRAAHIVCVELEKASGEEAEKVMRDAGLDVRMLRGEENEREVAKVRRYYLMVTNLEIVAITTLVISVLWFILAR